MEFNEDRFLISVREESGVSFSLHSLHATASKCQNASVSAMGFASDGVNCDASSSSSHESNTHHNYGNGTELSNRDVDSKSDTELDSEDDVAHEYRGSPSLLGDDDKHARISNFLEERNRHSSSCIIFRSYKDALLKNMGGKSKIFNDVEASGIHRSRSCPSILSKGLKRVCSTNHLNDVELFCTRPEPNLGACPGSCNESSRPTGSIQCLHNPLGCESSNFSLVSHVSPSFSNPLSHSMFPLHSSNSRAPDSKSFSKSFPTREVDSIKYFVPVLSAEADAGSIEISCDIRRSRFHNRTTKRKKKFVGDILGWKNKGFTSKKSNRAHRSAKKRKFTAKMTARPSPLLIRVGLSLPPLGDDTSISDDGISNRNRLLLDQAKEAWKLVNRLGVKGFGNDLKIVNNLAEIILNGANNALYA